MHSGILSLAPSRSRQFVDTVGLRMNSMLYRFITSRVFHSPACENMMTHQPTAALQLEKWKGSAAKEVALWKQALNWHMKTLLHPEEGPEHYDRQVTEVALLISSRSKQFVLWSYSTVPISFQEVYCFTLSTTQLPCQV